MQNAAGIAVSVPSEDRTNKPWLDRREPWLIDPADPANQGVDRIGDVFAHSATTSAVFIPPSFLGSRRAKLALPFPSHSRGGWREAPGGGSSRIDETPPTRHIVRKAHDAPPSPQRWGRDEDRRCLCLCAKTALTASLRAGRNRLLTVIASASEAIHRAEKKVGLLAQ